MRTAVTLPGIAVKGGGQSRCQFASGKTIRADFSPS
jgi:hypothetical protein